MEEGYFIIDTFFFLVSVNTVYPFNQGSIDYEKKDHLIIYWYFYSIIIPLFSQVTLAFLGE